LTAIEAIPSVAVNLAERYSAMRNELFEHHHSHSGSTGDLLAANKRAQISK